MVQKFMLNKQGNYELINIDDEPSNMCKGILTLISICICVIIYIPIINRMPQDKLDEIILLSAMLR